MHPQVTNFYLLLQKGGTVNIFEDIQKNRDKKRVKLKINRNTKF